MLTLASASGNVFAFAWKHGLEKSGQRPDGAELAARVCPRGHGLGLDGLFLLSAPKPGAVWDIEHWDADGSKSFCSNGTRAAAALLPDEFQGRIDACSSGEPVIMDRRGNTIGLRLPQGNSYRLGTAPGGLPFPAIYAWTGAPQLILEVPETDAIDLHALAPPLRFHPDLPFGANVSILQVLSPGAAKIRTWEKGVEGETQSCGQGAAAAAAWLAEQTGTMRWQIQPKGIDPLSLEVGAIVDRQWDELWLWGSVRILGHVSLGPSLFRHSP